MACLKQLNFFFRVMYLALHNKKNIETHISQQNILKAFKTRHNRKNIIYNFQQSKTCQSFTRLRYVEVYLLKIDLFQINYLTKIINLKQIKHNKQKLFYIFIKYVL